MKKPLQILIAMILLLTTIPVQTLQAESYKTMSDEELIEAKKLINYNIFLTGNHSANQADVEGPLAVYKNSSFGKDTSEFSYGAIFNSDANTVGLAPTDNEYISLLIGGKVNRIGGGNYELTMDYIKDKGKVKGRLVANEASINESKAAFKENLKPEQIFRSEEIDEIFTSLKNESNLISRKLNRYTNSSSKLLGETLGETWVDGRLVTYDMYQSDVDDHTILINIPPIEQEGSLETIVHSFGIPHDFSDHNVIVTSFVRNEQGDRVHSEKIAFKGNFLSDSNGSLHVADSEDRKAMAGKVTYYFPQATQITNFFNQVDYRTFINPKDINAQDEGVDTDGNFQYYKEYLSKYATGNNNNGSAASGGGSEVIGSVIAPLATIILTGSSINGFVSAVNLHQRNGAEVHNFRPTWIFEKEETLRTLSMKKVDTEGNVIKDQQARFALFRQAQGTKQYYKLVDNEVQWVTSDKAEEKSIQEGIATFVQLKPGTYYIEERVAPDGYEKAEPLKVVVKDNAPEVVEVDYVNKKEITRHQLSFRKVENESDESGLEGAEFVLVKKINDVPYYYVQFDDFVSWLPNVMFAKRFITSTDATVIENLEEGQYELWELKAPSGHIIEADQHIIKVTLDQDTELNITNKRIDPWDPQQGPKGQISIKKYALGQPIEQGLKGAEFILKGIGANNKEKYLYSYSKTEILWTEDRAQAHHFISNEEGIIQINNLNLGRYILEEINPPEGYDIIDTEFEIELYQELSEPTVHYHFNIPNEKKVGSLQIEKVEKDREAHKLSGAEFYLYKEIEGEKHYFTNDENIFSTDEDKAYIATTSIQGLATIEGIPYGEYFLHEKKAPNGFKPLTQQDLKFNISKEHKTAYLKVENERKTWPEHLEYGRLEIDKRSGEEVKIKLKGAQFVLHHESHGYFTGADPLFDDNIENAKVVVTDEQGQAAFNNVPIGKYHLIEIQAPDGYELVSEKIPVEIKSLEAGHVSFINVKNYKTIKLANLEILKVDSEDNETYLQGAQFLLSKEGLYYAGPKQDFTPNKADAFVLTTNQKGKIVVEDLPLGVYQLEEIKAPEGYELDETPIEISLSENNQANHHFITVTNNKEAEIITQGNLLIIKEDAETKERLAGAEFVIEQAGRYLGKDLWTENKDEALHLITDKNGTVQYDGLAFGSYNLIEVKAPAGYDILEKAIPFEISENNPAQLTTLKIENHLTEAPVIDELASLEIIKVDGENKDRYLAGAEFILSKEGLYYAGPKQDFTPNKADAFVLTTNQKGKIVVEDLPLGVYQLEEIKAPEGYELDKTPIEISLSENNQANHHFITVTNNKEAEVITQGNLLVIKEDAETKERLAGAEFVIEQAGRYLGKDLWTENKDEALHLITDKNGTVQYDGLAFGSYNLIEVKAPVGYDILEEAIPFEISENNPAQLTTLQIENHLTEAPVIDELASLEIIKVDGENKDRYLAGAEFILSKEGLYYAGPNQDFIPNKADAFVLTTNQKGKIVVEDLPLGVYQLEEIKAPEGYELDKTPIEISLSENNQANHHLITVTNNKEAEVITQGNLLIIKEDAETKERLAGAEFVIEQEGRYLGKDLWTENKDEALHLITDKNGTVQYDGLAFGSYNLIEVKAPVGYDILEKAIPFEISENNPAQLTTLQIENHLTEAPVIDELASLEIIKVDGENKDRYLAGAEFILSKEGLYYAGPNQDFTPNKADAFVLTTNQEGKIVVEDLPLGVYQLEEIKAPEGYELDGNHYEIVLDRKEVTIKVQNFKKMVPNIPQTGQGNEFIIVAGILVLLGVLFKLWKRK